MALQTLAGGGFWAPNWIPTVVTLAATTYVIDASGEVAALILRAPKTGNIDRFDFLIGTVTNSPDNGLRASLQTVNAATGLQTGTILGATNNAFVTYPHTVTTGWKSTNFGEVAAVTRGDWIALVVDFPTFVASDSVALSHWATGQALGVPYGISATNTLNNVNMPIMALHYTTGYAFLSPLIQGADTHPTVVYASNTAVADEWGMGFQVPFPCTLDSVAFYAGLSTTADYEIVVYDSDGTTVLNATTIDASMQSGNTRAYLQPLSGAVNLLANTTYRVTLRPTSTNAITLHYFTFQSVDLMATLEGGSAFYMTSQIDQGGTWTNYNSGTFRRPRMSVYVTAFDDAASGAGGNTISAGRGQGCVIS